MTDDDFNFGDMFLSIENIEPPEDPPEEPPEDPVPPPVAARVQERPHRLLSEWLTINYPAAYVNELRNNPDSGGDFVFCYGESPDVEEGDSMFMITPRSYYAAHGSISDEHFELPDAVAALFECVQESCFLFTGTREQGEILLRGIGMIEVDGI
jgi:hypothetical protein